MIVYHYCSIDTFFAIIQNMALRLSDITKSNDSMEISWINNLAKEVFIEEYEKDEAKYFKDAYSKRVYEELLDRFQSDFFDEQHRMYSYYVCCFSEAESGDLLSQWRGYADDGRGVSIGFDVDVLKKFGLPKDDDPISGVIFEFGKVEYSETRQKAEVRSLANKLIRDLKEIANSKISDEQEIKRVSMPAFNRCFFELFKKAVLMKNPFFKEEKEWRLCFMYNTNNELSPSARTSKILLRDKVRFNDISFQNRNGKIVSYLDLSFKNCSKQIVKEIVIGPKSQNTEADITAFLCNDDLNLDLSGIEIRKSKGTYR